MKKVYYLRAWFNDYIAACFFALIFKMCVYKEMNEALSKLSSGY